MNEIRQYNLDLFTEKCHAINQISEGSEEGLDALVRVMAQALHEHFNRPSLIEIFMQDLLSETCQDLCKEN